MVLIKNLESIQRIICEEHNAEYLSSSSEKKIGISLNIKDHKFPINGLRHPPEGDTTGWYIWGGEHLSEDDNFFQPLHVIHLDSWCPDVQKFLGLPPGWRFLITEDYEDVWFDSSLLEL